MLASSERFVGFDLNLSCILLYGTLNRFQGYTLHFCQMDFEPVRVTHKTPIWKRMRLPSPRVLNAYYV